jgi:hypothetical protein
MKPVNRFFIERKKTELVVFRDKRISKISNTAKREKILTAMVDRAIHFIGEGYDINELLRIFFDEYGHNPSSKIICSELVGYVYGKGGIQLNMDDHGFFTPGSISEDINLTTVTSIFLP